MKSTESRTMSRISPKTPLNGLETKSEVLSDSAMRLIMPMMKAKLRAGMGGKEKYRLFMYSPESSKDYE